MWVMKSNTLRLMKVTAALWRAQDNGVRVAKWGGYYWLTVQRTIGGELRESFCTRRELIRWYERQTGTRIVLAGKEEAL